MGLSTALNNSLSGLNAASRRADVTSNNIANASTEGYARRSTELSSISLNGAGAGVRIDGVTVAQVENLTNDRRRAEAALGFQSQLTEIYAEIERLVGGPDDPGALFARYDRLEGSFRRLSDEPESTSAQYDVVASAKDLTLGFNQAQEGLTALRENLDREIGRLIDEANDSLIQLQELNKQVQRDLAIDRDAAEAINARQIVADRLAEIVPIKTKIGENGVMQVFTVGGAALVDLTAAEFSFTSSPLITPDADYRNGVGVLSGLAIDGLDVTPGTTVFGGMEGGQLEALFEGRDALTVEFQSQLDALANDLIDRFDDPAVEPGLAAGAPGLFTDNGGGASGLPGVAGRLAVNAAVDPDAGGDLYRVRDGVTAVAPGDVGDNAHAIDLLEAFTAANPIPAGVGLSGDRGSTLLLADFTSLIATKTQSSETAQAMRSARFDSLSKAEAVAIGVDIDTELQDLTLIEKTYAANAQVMNVIDDLFDLLLQRL